jgi:hypothetical protein
MKIGPPTPREANGPSVIAKELRRQLCGGGEDGAVRVRRSAMN